MEEFKCQCEGPGACPFWRVEMPAGMHKKCSGQSGLPRKKELDIVQKFVGQNKVSTPEYVEPSLGTKITSFVQSAVKHIANGASHVSEEIKQERLTICEACPEKTLNQLGMAKCIVCGCMLELKTGWATEECPLGKWPKLSLPVIEIQQEKCCRER